MHERQAVELVLWNLKSAGSTDSKKRSIAVCQVRFCFQNLRASCRHQETVDLAEFLLERGLMQAVASGMRELVAGDWGLSLLEKELFLSSRSDSKIVANKALLYVQCLSSLGVDSRCKAFIHKEFPDLAKVAKSLFLMQLSTEKIGCESANTFQKDARAEILRCLMNVMPGPHSYMKKVADNVVFLKQVLSYAASIREGTSKDDASHRFTVLAFVYNALVTRKADLRTLRSELYALVEYALKQAESTKQVDVAIRLLFLIVRLDLHETGISEHPDLGSSIVALLSLEDMIGDVAWNMAFYVAAEYFKRELKDLSNEKTLSFFNERFRSDEKAMRKAAQVRKLFSAPTEKMKTSCYVERRRAKEDAELQAVQKVMSSSPAVPSRPRLDRRNCSQNNCGNVETMAGSFRVCGRCRLAVYCSRGKLFG